MLPITSVNVECISNKAVFDGQATFTMPNYLIVDTYSVPRISSGEAVTLDCAQRWELWLNEADGAFVLGDMMQPPLSPIVVPFTVSDSVQPVTPQKAWLDAAHYRVIQPSALDAELRLTYRVFGGLVSNSQTIRLKAETRTDGFKWRIAPTSEALIPDSATGFLVQSSGKNAIRLAATGRFMRHTN